MRQLSEAVSKVTSKNFSKKYIAIGKILSEWENLMGEDLAKKTQPIKINYRKHRNSKKPTAILDIAATASVSTTLHYQKDLILEKINKIFGEGWITDIKFVNTVNNKDLKEIRTKQKRILTNEEKTFLSDILSCIEDQELKDSLNKLGQGIIKRKS